MITVLGEDDGLAKTVTAIDLQPVDHRMLQHLVDDVGVEELLVNRINVDPVWDTTVLIPIQGVPLLLLFLTEVVVGDALPLESEESRDDSGRHKVGVPHILIETIGVCGNTPLQIEQHLRLQDGEVVLVEANSQLDGYQDTRQLVDRLYAGLPNG
jgi:hypothetical protein